MRVLSALISLAMRVLSRQLLCSSTVDSTQQKQARAFQQCVPWPPFVYTRCAFNFKRVLLSLQFSAVRVHRKGSSGRSRTIPRNRRWCGRSTGGNSPNLRRASSGSGPDHGKTRCRARPVPSHMRAHGMSRLTPALCTPQISQTSRRLREIQTIVGRPCLDSTFTQGARTGAREGGAGLGNTLTLWVVELVANRAVPIEALDFVPVHPDSGLLVGGAGVAALARCQYHFGLPGQQVLVVHRVGVRPL